VVPAGRETQHRPVEFGGPGEAFVRTVANLAYGGQVVLTERAWVSVQDHIPGQAQVTTLCSCLIATPGNEHHASCTSVHARTQQIMVGAIWSLALWRPACRLPGGRHCRGTEAKQGDITQTYGRMALQLMQVLQY